MAFFQLGSPANSRVQAGLFFRLFLAILPSALVEELPFGKAVFFLDASFADGIFDGNLAVNSLRVDKDLASYSFGVFL
jgi:hypothetical protein